MSASLVGSEMCIRDSPKPLKYPLKIQNKGIYNLSKSCDKVF
ncbi:hypothetical protein JMUB7536_27620 [Staphylococcus aureus]